MTRYTLLVLAVGMLIPAQLPAQDAETDLTGRNEIRALIGEYVDAYNHRDAKALASYWSPDAVYTNRTTGEQVTGRTAIEEQFAQQFAGGDDEQLDITIGSIEFVSPNVAVENSTARLTSAGADPVEVDYAAVYVRHQGQWLLDRVTGADIPAVTSHYDRLRELEWLVGRWVDEDESARIVTECDWTRNNNFLTRSFTVAIGDQIDMAGMQVVGWDAAAERIRSWTFDSDGGISEGRWSQKGDRWFIQKSGVLADGRRATSTNIITRIDDNTLTLESVNRTVDGELLSDIGAIRIVRK